MKALILVNNCPIHLLQQMSFMIEKFVANRGIETVDNLTDADALISCYPLSTHDKIVFSIDKTKMRGVDNYVVDLYEYPQNVVKEHCLSCKNKYLQWSEYPCSDCSHGNLHVKI